jgi:hypothetical protein
MKKACDKNQILKATGIIAIHCRAVLDFALAEGETAAEKIQELIAGGDAFFINSDKKLVMTPNFTEATQGTRADGTTIPVEGAVEGYTVEFPETLAWSRKLKSIKDCCDRMYLVDEDEGIFTVYGLGDESVPTPFDMTSISTAMANGRFGHTTSLPINTIMFKMDDMDYITNEIAEIEVTELDEFEIARIGVATDTVSFYSASKPYNSADAKIKIAATTVVDLDAFEFSGDYVATSATTTTGSIVFAPTLPAETTITQIAPVDGMLSLEPITTPAA